MNIRTAGLGCVILLAGVATAQSPQSAADRAAERVEHLVQPRSRAGLVSGPVQWPGAKAVEEPQSPLALYAGLPPQPPVVTLQQARPRPAPEAQPPAAQGPMPKGAPMPTKPVVQLPAADVDKPLPIPVLGQPKLDRAALDDTTLEASRAAALTRVRPRRTGPVPFTPQNLPDPFENQRSGALQNPPAESDQPPAVPIRTPK